MKFGRSSLVAAVLVTSMLPLAAVGASPRISNSGASTPSSFARHPHAGSTAPSAPGNVTAMGGDSSASVSWGGVDGADGYVAMADPGGYSCQTASTSCVITGLTNGTTYTITVTASSGGVVSSPSASITVTPQAGPPAQVSGINAFTIGSTATVTWLPATS